MPTRPTRPTRPALSREYILRVTLAMIDRDGLDALTMRRLGDELDVNPMAVYHYVPNKAALLDGVAELLWRDGLDLDDTQPDQDWRTLLQRAMTGFHRNLLAHPRAVTLAATHPLVTTEQFDFLERALSALQRAGLRIDATTLALLNVVGTFTLGHAVASVVEPVGTGGGTGADSGTGSDANANAKNQSADHLIAAVADFPLLSGVIGASIDAGNDFESDFRTGLSVILAGWPG